MSEVAQFKEVHLDSQALLKIVRHCKESLPDLVSGVLIGIDINDVLEISDCFPQVTEEDSKEDNYVVNMLQALNQVGAVASNVGWYNTTYLSEYVNVDFIHEQYCYQSTVPTSVCIIYDPYTTEKGRLPIKAIRLTPAFMDLYANGKFNAKNAQKFNLRSSNIFEVIPIKVKNYALAEAFIYDITSKDPVRTVNERLSTSNSALIEKLVEFVSSSIDEYSESQDKYRAFQANYARQKLELAKKSEYIAEENARRKKDGRELLPVVDTSVLNKLVEPSRLDTLSLTSRIEDYSVELTGLSYSSYINQSILSAFMKSGAEEENTATTTE